MHKKYDSLTINGLKLYIWQATPGKKDYVLDRPSQGRSSLIMSKLESFKSYGPTNATKEMERDFESLPVFNQQLKI